MRVGLTGGLGAGKSTVGKALAARGAAVIDADQVARKVIEPGSAGERAVLERFGPAVKGPDGHLDRQALAAVVFADAPERLALEAITHPLVHEEIARELASSPAEVVVIELPLLTAGGRQQYGLDFVVLVDTPEELAVRRAVGRGMTEQDVRARMAAQPSSRERRAASDWVLVNDGDQAQLEAAVDDLWALANRNEQLVLPTAAARRALAHHAGFDVTAPRYHDRSASFQSCLRVVPGRRPAQRHRRPGRGGADEATAFRRCSASRAAARAPPSPGRSSRCSGPRSSSSPTSRSPPSSPTRCARSSPTTGSSTSSVTTTTTSPRPTSPPATPISKKTARSTTRSTVSATRPPPHC